MIKKFFYLPVVLVLASGVAYAKIRSTPAVIVSNDLAAKLLVEEPIKMVMVGYAPMEKRLGPQRIDTIYSANGSPMSKVFQDGNI